MAAAALRMGEVTMTDPDDREAGFYWISIDGQEAEVAQWQLEWGTWLVIGRMLPLTDEMGLDVQVRLPGATATATATAGARCRRAVPPAALTTILYEMDHRQCCLGRMHRRHRRHQQAEQWPSSLNPGD